MGKASKSLYTIGKIVNIIMLVLTTIGVIVGVLAMVFKNNIAESALMSGLYMLNSVNGIHFTALSMVITSGVMLALNILYLALAGWAQSAIGNGRVDVTPHVSMIVVRELGNVFYLLGGIFGIVEETAIKSRV